MPNGFNGWPFSKTKTHEPEYFFWKEINGIGSILLFVRPINNLCLRRRQKVQRVIKVLSSTPYNTSCACEISLYRCDFLPTSSCPCPYIWTPNIRQQRKIPFVYKKYINLKATMLVGIWFRNYWGFFYFLKYLLINSQFVVFWCVLAFTETKLFKIYF